MHVHMANGVSALCLENVLVKVFYFKEIYLMNLFCYVLNFSLVCGSYTSLCLNFEKAIFQCIMFVSNVQILIYLYCFLKYCFILL